MPDWDNKDMELQTIDETDGFEGVEGLGLGEGDSLYFTPSGTPLRFRFSVNFSLIIFESIQGGSWKWGSKRATHSQKNGIIVEN